MLLPATEERPIREAPPSLQPGPHGPLAIPGALTDLEAERSSEVLGPGVAAIEHVQHHTTAAPDVHLGITGLAHHHLWRHVGLCTRDVVPCGGEVRQKRQLWALTGGSLGCDHPSQFLIYLDSVSKYCK